MKIKVGTDCSGIDAPIQALLNIGVNFSHIFSSDIDNYCIKSIKANYKPKIIFGDKEGQFPNGDITKRNLKNVPDIDLYICGFPCQPFSLTGKQKGFRDKRSNVFFECIHLIVSKKPKIFILENVKGLVSNNKGKTWEIILQELESIEKYYNIYYDILNTRSYGIPQNRERLFIVGIKKNIQTQEFTFPEHVKMKDIKHFIDNTDNSKDNITPTVKNTLDKSPKNAIFVDTCQPKNRYPNSHLWSPTLTTGNGLWCVPKKRHASLKEKIKLQGFPVNFKQVVSNTQFNKQLGNTISVNVLEYLIKECLDCIF